MSGAEGPLRIAVAGGSIGGLCTGLALGGAGFNVQVYECVAGPMETRGAGIVVQGDLIDLLRTHGTGALPTTQCKVRRYLSPSSRIGAKTPIRRVLNQYFRPKGLHYRE